jgi:glycosyltransferase involved in cell wall biosynthesis
LRITIVHPNGAGALFGGFKVIAQRAAELQRLGHKVLLVSPKPERPRRFAGPLRRLPFYGPSRENDSFLKGRGLKNVVLDRWRPVTAADLPDADVVMGTWWETMEWVDALPASKGVKMQFVQHYEVFDHLPRDRARAVLAMPHPKIVVASWIAEKIGTHGDAPVAVVANDIDTAAFRPPVGNEDRPPVFGICYAEGPVKNMALAFDAFAALEEARPDARLIAFGAHPPSPMHMRLLDRFEMAPAQDAIPSLYGTCRAWLMPSTSEGFGLPILEALACGTPVISTPTGIAADVLDGSNGEVVPQDPSAFEGAMRRFVDIPGGEWVTASARARRAAERWSLSANGKAFEAAILSLMDLAADTGQTA